MKKFFKMLTALLAMVLVFTVASCAKDEGPKEFEGTAQDFINLLNIDEHRQTVAADFTLPSKLTQGATSVDITWTSDNEALLKLEKGESSWTAKITQSKEEKAVTFNASVTYKEQTATKQFKIKIAKAISTETVLAVVADPKVDVEYSFFMDQKNLSKKLFFAGAMDGYYFKTTDDQSQEVKVKLETNGEGYSLYFMSGDKKQYLNVVPRMSDDHLSTSQSIDDTSKTVYKFDKEHKVLSVTLTEGEFTDTFVFGTNSAKKYNSISTTPSKYIDKCFYAHFGEETEAFKTVKDPKVDVEYSLFMDHKKLSKKLFFAGDMAGYYFKTTDDQSKETKVKLEVKGEGYAIYFMDGEAKKYINVGPRISGDHLSTSQSIDAESKTEYKFDKETGAFSVTLTKDNFTDTFTLGTNAEKTFDTIGTLKSKDTARCYANLGLGQAEAPKEEEVEVVKTEFTGVVTMSSFSKGSVTIQNANGATTLRPSKDVFTEEKWNATFVVGKELTVKGKAADFNGLKQLEIGAEADVTVKGTKEVPAALDITEIVKTSTDLKADLLAHQSKLVVVKGVTFKDGKLYIGEKFIKYYHDDKICADAPALVENGTYDITGILNWFNGPQVSPVTKEGVKAVTLA